MNFREGMRRVGLTLGTIGCLAGLLIGISLSYDAWHQRNVTRMENLQFQSLMNSVVMKMAMKQITARNVEDDVVKLKYVRFEGRIYAALEDASDEEIGNFIEAWSSGAAPANGTMSAPPSERIEGVHIDQTGKPFVLDMANGRSIYYVESPPVSWASVLLLAGLPVVGFFLPWGIVRLITWVGLGFTHNSK